MLPENSLSPLNPNSPASDAVNGIAFWTRYIVHAWAAMMYAFTRRSFGREFFNWWGMSGLLVLSFWACVTTPPDEALPLSVMMAIFVALCLWHKRHSPKELEGEVLHTRYSGWPRVCDLLPISERFAKSFFEPGAIFMLGLGVDSLHHGLGLFIMLGGVACLLDWLYLSRRNYYQASQLHNAEKEQQRTMETHDHYFRK